MTKEDRELLSIYMSGFEDELAGIEKDPILEPLQKKAYIIGRMDAIAGDDLSSIDEQTDEEILHHIKHGRK